MALCRSRYDPRRINTASSCSRGLVRGYLLSYLLILLLPILLGITFYTMASSFMQQQADRANITRLRDAMELTTNQLHTMITFIDRIAVNQTVTALASMSQRRPSTTDINQVIASADAFRRYNDTNPLIAEYYIHYRQSGITLSSRNVYLDFSRFYGEYFQWNDLTMQEWLDLTVSQRSERVILPAATVTAKDNRGSIIDRGLVYLQSLPIEYRSRNDGYLAVLIRESEIHRLLKGVELGNRGQIAIIGRDGQVMTDISAGQSPPDLVNSLPELPADPSGHFRVIHEDAAYSVSYVRAEDFGWTYLAAIPYDYVYSQLVTMRRILLIALILILTCGIILAIRLSQRNARPWLEISRVIGNNLSSPGLSSESPDVHQQRETDRIRQGVLQIIQSSQNLNQVLVMQMPVIQDSLISRLLTGRINDEAQLSRELRLARISLQAAGYLVVLIRIDSPADLIDTSEEQIQESAILRLALQEYIRKHYPGQVCSTDDILDKTTGYLLMLDHLEPDPVDGLRMMLSGWQHDFRSSYQLLTRISAGTVCSQLLDINRSFEEARQAMAYAKLDQPAWYADLPTRLQAYYYPQELENQLLQLVHAGQTTAIETIFDRIYEENITK